MHQYREGKVKSTPTRGVKEILKPDAYQQSEVQRSEISDQRSDVDLISDLWFLISGLTAYLLYNGSASWSW